MLGGGGDDETLSHRLRYRGRRMGDRVRGVGGVFGRGGDQYEMCSLDRGACAYWVVVTYVFRFIRSKGRLEMTRCSLCIYRSL